MMNPMSHHAPKFVDGGSTAFWLYTPEYHKERAGYWLMAARDARIGGYPDGARMYLDRAADHRCIARNLINGTRKLESLPLVGSEFLLEWAA